MEICLGIGPRATPLPQEGHLPLHLCRWVLKSRKYPLTLGSSRTSVLDAIRRFGLNKALSRTKCTVKRLVREKQGVRRKWSSLVFGVTRRLQMKLMPRNPPPATSIRCAAIIKTSPESSNPPTTLKSKFSRVVGGWWGGSPLALWGCFYYLS